MPGLERANAKTGLAVIDVRELLKNPNITSAQRAALERIVEKWNIE